MFRAIILVRAGRPELEATVTSHSYNHKTSTPTHDHTKNKPGTLPDDGKVRRLKG